MTGASRLARPLLIVVLSLSTLVAIAWSQAVHRTEESARELARRAISSQSGPSDEIVEDLRACGPEVLSELLEWRRELHEAIHAPATSETAKADPKLARLDELIDRVAGQRYACVSQLYWYTDFEKAQRQAAASGKPILSLRMLGNLTDEYSCANSRFFRTTLYAHETISKKLREEFILHWKSVRPVPRVMIDFGDGRKLERTITGNSAHYLLTAEGTPLDVLPGLHGPEQFLAWLNAVGQLHAEVKNLPSHERDGLVEQFHIQESMRIDRAYADDLAATGLRGNVPDAPLPTAVVSHNGNNVPPPAIAAARIAQPKGLIERSILRGIANSLDTSPQRLDEAAWFRIAALPRHAVALDRSTVSIIQRENPTARQAGDLARPKLAIENPILNMVAGLMRSIAVDGVRNEYLLHRQIHDWFAARQVQDIDSLNERVYAELFLTPSSDPWLGLATEGAYTGLDNGGMSVAAP